MSNPPLELPPLPTFAHPMHEALFWRGVFVHRYAGVEHTVTELLLRAGGRDEYRHFGDVPYPWRKKLARLGAILDLPGPLQPHATAVRDSLIPLTGAEQHRHLLVHGMMSLDVLKDNPRMLFLKTHQRVGKYLGEATLWITIEELIDLTQGMAPYVQTFVQLVAGLFRHLDLQPIETADRQELETGVRQF